MSASSSAMPSNSLLCTAQPRGSAQELLAQLFEARDSGSIEKVTATIAAPPEFHRGCAGRDRRQAAIGAHRLADGDEVRRGVEQGAVHVEENCSNASAYSSRRVWIM
jgi:hypothetical protein